ncbi:MAG: hypothetical protein QM611_05275 [Microbacterium sp.]|uniref:hypothetical protein n=1 Tax=Microbacterium sp. TaxID=51671 RepID=UPI0039E4E600
MKKWVVRFASLLVFNVVVLLLIGWLTPARVGWAALWAGVVLTVLVVCVKPLIAAWFASMAAKSASQRTKAGEKLVELLLALAVALAVWIATVLLTGVRVGGTPLGWFWGYVLPPVILLVGWAVYDVIDDRVEARAGALYDNIASRSAAAGTPAPPGRPRELDDGLTDEQRKMLDDLG